jgi:UDP-glucuronate 4-epimerase
MEKVSKKTGSESGELEKNRSKIRRVLVTGAAGFIGFHLSERLLSEGVEVTGLDNLNSYYEVSLKEARLDRLKGKKGFSFIRMNLEDRDGTEGVFSAHRFDAVVHLAAQAGVRYSLLNPHDYVQSNVVGFLNVLEGCRRSGVLHGDGHGVRHLVFASSSSVYGANRNLPYSVRDNVDHPLSLYAATKKADELMAHAYSSLYGIPCTGLRFFTVYGPWGRPDMSYFKFTKQIVEGSPIEVYNYGKMKRDFTYIDDVVEGLVRVIPRAPEANASWEASAPDPGTSFAPYRIYNIGNNQPVDLLAFISVLEAELGRKAEMRLLPMQRGDVEETCADIRDLERDVGFRPATDLREGIRKFTAWYREYYHLDS